MRGREGHAYIEPTVRFHGGKGEGWKALNLALESGLPVAAIRRTWPVLDGEPTAALDARSEYEVFKRFRDLSRGKTAIIISHRFSTVRMADRILVLDSGQVVEAGSHEDLVVAGGRYAELFELQAAGYR